MKQNRITSAGTAADSGTQSIVITFDDIEANPLLDDGLSGSFWDFHIKQRKVEPLSKPCKDCAITTGFYTDIADELKKETKQTIEAVVETWFCHNNCNRGCAGIRKYIK